MKISQKNKILTYEYFENCNDNLWTPCIFIYLFKTELKSLPQKSA